MLERLFDRNRILKLFNSPRSSVTTRDGFYELSKRETPDRYEFRFGTEFLTVKRFFIDKDLNAKKNLIKVLKELGVYVEYFKLPSELE